LTLSSSLVERSFVGVAVASSRASIECIAVRDASQVDAEAYGILFAYDIRAATGTVRQSIVERARSAGILAVGSEVDVKAVTVRDTIV
jgi:hypothetical protein